MEDYLFFLKRRRSFGRFFFRPSLFLTRKPPACRCTQSGNRGSWAAPVSGILPPSLRGVLSENSSNTCRFEFGLIESPSTRSLLLMSNQRLEERLISAPDRINRNNHHPVNFPIKTDFSRRQNHQVTDRDKK
jgi:hypothetical protein